MNTETTKGLTHKLTSGIFFSQDRNITKAIVERVVNHISPKLDKDDADILSSLEVVAPSPKAFMETVPTRTSPTVWLSPQIETEADYNNEMAEYHVACGLAEGLLLSQGCGRNQLDQRTRETLKGWNFSIPAGAQRGEAVGA